MKTVVLLESGLARDEQVEQSNMVNEVAGADDVKCDVRGQSTVTHVECIAGPERRAQLNTSKPS